MARPQRLLLIVSEDDRNQFDYVFDTDDGRMDPQTLMTLTTIAALHLIDMGAVMYDRHRDEVAQNLAECILKVTPAEQENSPHDD